MTHDSDQVNAGAGQSPSGQIVSVDAAATWPLRHLVLRSGMPFASARMDGDDDPRTQHFAAVHSSGRIVGVATLMQEGEPGSDGGWRLRGMATDPEVRGKGCGQALVEAVMAAAAAGGAAYVWAHARTPALGFYQRLGFTVHSGVYDIPSAGPHVLIRRRCRA